MEQFEKARVLKECGRFFSLDYSGLLRITPDWPGPTPPHPPLQGVTVSQSLVPLMFFEVSGCHKPVTRVSQGVTPCWLMERELMVDGPVRFLPPERDFCGDIGDIGDKAVFAGVFAFFLR